jgi:hypothetical protein
MLGHCQRVSGIERTAASKLRHLVINLDRGGCRTHLIGGAAIRAVLGGQEASTRALLDTVHTGHAAESATRRAGGTR